MPTGGDLPRRSPAHAGPLRSWERLTFALAFVVAAAIIATLSVSEAHTHPAGTRDRRGVKQTMPAAARPAPGGGWGPVVLAGPASIRFSSSAARSDRLAAALAPVLRHGTGSLAAGVVDAATGAVAVFDGDRPFHAASVVKADILAALLLEHQWAQTPLSTRERALAAGMIEDGNDQAANDLWDAAGGADGLRAANQQLGLRQTTPGGGTDWALTSTTVDDQLRLLADLTSSHSPLSPGARSYELGLMQHVAAGQAWGVTAAAVPGTAPAVKDGWLPDGSQTTWVINSIGVISRGGHPVLVAVLSSGQPSESAGIAQVEAAARAAVTALTGARA